MLGSCAKKPSEPEAFLPAFFMDSYDFTDWSLYITCTETTDFPETNKQIVNLYWHGHEQGIYPDVVPVLRIDGEQVPLQFSGTYISVAYSGVFYKPAQTIVLVTLSLDGEVLIDVPVKLVDTIDSFEVVNPPQNADNIKFAWTVEHDSPHQILEIVPSYMLRYDYITPSFREHEVPLSTFSSLEQDERVMFFLRQINLIIRNRIFIRSTSFALLSHVPRAK